MSESFSANTASVVIFLANWWVWSANKRFQSPRAIAKRLMYHYRKMCGHSSSVTSLRRHVKERKTHGPNYVGSKLYASLHTKTVIQHLFSLGLTISYDRCLSICNNISLNMLEILKVYLLLAILPLKNLRLLQRIILTSILYQLRWRNTFMELV